MDNPSPVFIDLPNHSVDINSHEFEHQWKLYDARFEYAWRYFDFHAKQRTTMFNFFVVFSGFLVNAYILLLQRENYGLLLIACAFGTVITVFFVFLERRNEELVHVAEDILRSLEKDVLFKDFKRTIKWPQQRSWLGRMDAKDTMIPLGIFIRQDYDEGQHRKSKYLHGIWLPRVQLTIAWMYFLLALYSLYRLQDAYVCRIYTFWQFVSTLSLA